MAPCGVVSDAADKVNVLEVSEQLVLPRVVIVTPNNGILSKT